MYQAYVCQIKNLRNHPNADRLFIGECFGNTVAVSRTGYTPDMIGVYFPQDGQLSVEFAEYNNLLRKKDAEGNQIGGYMDPDKRNVTAIRLRGEKSDGLFLPLSCLDYCFEDGAAAHLNIGDTITVVNGHDICTKYIPRTNHRSSSGPKGNKTRKHTAPIAPLFVEHADTEQLAYNLEVFKPGDEIEITLKMHGTSQRTGYLPKLVKMHRTLLDKILKRPGTPVYDWGYVTGTRRVILNDFDGGFYGSNAFREQHAKVFEGKLWKGESVYYEVVGFTDSGVPIMADGNNKKLNDKEFIKQYGQTTTFSYGCSPTGEGEPESYWDEENTEPCVVPIVPQSDIYVYRMTMTNEDGNVVEYTPDFMRYRCEQMGIKTVPVMWKGIIPRYDLLNGEHVANNEKWSAGDWIKSVAERYYDGPDPIGKTHIREGVVVRIVNKPKFCAYKHKNFAFKVLEGIIKESAAAPDMEEAQEIKEV